MAKTADTFMAAKKVSNKEVKDVSRESPGQAQGHGSC